MKTPTAPTLHGGRIGIDLGGTKTEVIALAPTGQTVHRERVPTKAAQYDAILETIATLVERADGALGHRGAMGIGIPGALSRTTGLVKNANTTTLIGKPLDLDLAARCGRPVKVENDANCFTLSEAVDGAGADADLVFGVILGTGVGGGICFERRVLQGVNHIAGEWGHNPLPYPSGADLPLRPCYCGRVGCIETYLCGPAVEREFEVETGKKSALAELPHLAARGDLAAKRILERHADRLARSLATVVNILDPTVIVLGGGVSNLPGLAQATAQRLSPWVFSDSIATAIRVARHGDASGVRGAAWL